MAERDIIERDIIQGVFRDWAERLDDPFAFFMVFLGTGFEQVWWKYAVKEWNRVHPDKPLPEMKIKQRRTGKRRTGR